LSPNVVGGVDELVRLLHHTQQARTLFARSTAPTYERITAALSPAIAGLGAIAGLWLMRGRWPRSSAVIALVAFGLLYFPSIPFILTQSGNEGARRSWAFTYIGLCLLLATVVAWLPRALARFGPYVRTAVLGCASALLAVVLVGNVAAHINPETRFPGPYIYGIDARSLTPELLGATDWFQSTYGIDHQVIADRYGGLAFASFGREWTANPSPGFPVWQLYFQVRRPSAKLLGELRQARWRYMVVDDRMARSVPQNGEYFNRTEPKAVVRTQPVPRAALTKYNSLPWAIKVYQSTNLEIYRLDFTALNAKWPPRGKTG
jgi:hypothetical protein